MEQHTRDDEEEEERMGENDHLDHPGRSMMIMFESDQEETYYMLT